MTTNNSNQLALFTFTAPTLLPGLNLKEKKGENGATISMMLTLDARKDIKKATRKDGDALAEHILGLSDTIKSHGIGEFAKLAASADWTGGNFKITESKSGKRRATMSLVSVNREAKQVSQEQVAKALASMTDAQVAALLEQAANIQKQLAATNVESTVESSEAAAPAAK